MPLAVRELRVAKLRSNKLVRQAAKRHSLLTCPLAYRSRVTTLIGDLSACE